MRKLDENWPFKTKKLFELIENQTDGNVSEFANLISVDQQRINRLFLKDKRSGDFPRMSKELESAIREVIDLPLDYFMPSPVKVEVNPLDYLFPDKKERFRKAYSLLKHENVIKSQSDVAKAMGLSRLDISNALNGNEVLTDIFLIRFSNAFRQISVDWLLNGTEPMLTISPEFKDENTPQVLVGDVDKDIIEEQKKITERIMELVNDFGHIPKTFALKSDIEVSLFLKKLKGNATWSVADIHKICDTYKIRKGWIVDGEGQKFRLPEDVLENIPARSNVTRAGVPYFNIDFDKGYDIDNDRTINPDYMINLTPYNKADCWCNATGNSMHPTISNGDLIAIKEVRDPQSCLISGEVYAIVTTNELRTIKRVKDNGDTITLIPDNKDYPEQTISKKLILKAYHVLGSVNIKTL